LGDQPNHALLSGSASSDMIVLGPAVLITAEHWNQITVPACWPNGKFE